METHDHRRSEGSDAQGENLSADKILDRIPAQCPADAGEVNHYDGSCASVPSDCRLNFPCCNIWYSSKVYSDIENGDKLNDDADREGSFATEKID